MTAFNSRKENIFHYVTFVTFCRVPVFKSAVICQFFIDALRETKATHPFKLVAYVIMPDHVHLIINPVGCDIELVGKTIKGKSTKKTLDWLKENEHFESLTKLKRIFPQKRNHSYSVWQKGIKSVDIESHKFVIQKTNYTHMNPARANLCDHPARWKWSSFGAYLPRGSEVEIPIEIDRRPYWEAEELAAAKERSKTAS